MIFPTYAETHDRVRKLACRPDEWQDLIKKLTVFAHSDVSRLFIMLHREEVHFAEHCCRLLRLDCLTSGKSSLGDPRKLSVLQTPNHANWPRTVELAKPGNWNMKTAVPPKFRAYRLRRKREKKRPRAPRNVYYETCTPHTMVTCTWEYGYSARQLAGGGVWWVSITPPVLPSDYEW